MKENLLDDTDSDKSSLNDNIIELGDNSFEQREKDRKNKSEKMKQLDEENLKKGKSVSFFKILYSEAKTKEYILTIIAFLNSILIGLAMPMFSLIFGNTINDFGSGVGKDFLESISNMCLRFVYLAIAMLVAGTLATWLWTYTGRITVKRIKSEYFRYIMNQEQAWFDEIETFQFSTKIQTQSTTIENGLGQKLDICVRSLTMFMASFVLGFTTSWSLSLVLLSTFPLLLIGGWYISKVQQEGSKRNRGAFEKAGGIAEEVLYQIKTVASFANFKWEKNRFEEKLEESYKAGRTNSFKNGLGTGLIVLSIYGSYTLAIWYGSLVIHNQDINPVTGNPFKAGDVLTCLFSIVFGAMSLGQASPSMKAIAEACSAAFEFYELKKRVPKIDLTTSTLKPEKEKVKGNIKFKNVSFTYPAKPDKQIFEDLNFEIEPGTKIAFVGKSGSGKSTIVNLIERLYDVSNGEISIDDYNLKNLNLEYFRSIIGYVPQEPVLFNTTIRENIIFGRKGVTEEDIIEACKKAYAEEFINKNEMGLDYIVGVKGGKLSGGQKQRIAIARAILCKPKILILDEATSALDNKSEKEVQRALDQVSQGITTIIIAHRLSTIINANKIFVLRNGKIIERGTHEQLINLAGRYSNLFKNQIGLNEDNETLERKISQQSGSRRESKISAGEQIIEAKDTKEQIEKVLAANKQKDEQFNKTKKKLVPIMMENKLVLITGTIFASISGAVWPTYGILLAESISSLSDPNLEIVKTDGFKLSMYFLTLAVSSGVAVFFQTSMFGLQGEYLTKRLRSIIYDKYLRLHMGYYDNPENTPGALLTKLSSDTTKVNGIALSMFSIMVQSIVTLILGVSLGIVYEWRIGLITIGFVPFIILTSGIQWRLMQNLSIADDVIESQAGSILSESVCNTKTIYSYNMQSKVVEMYKAILESKDKSVNKSSFINGILFGLSQFFIFIIYAVLFYAGAQFMVNSDTPMSLGDFLKGIYCIIFAAFGLGQAQQYLGDMGKAKDALLNIFKTIDEPTQIDPLEIRTQCVTKEIEGKIEFRNVTFSYPTRPDVKVFENLSFKILPGQSVAFVGYSGCGKSSIIQLLERFYNIESGEILIDDINISDYDLITLRKQISLVMQEPVLFKRDIIENIQYGDLEADYSSIVEASNKAQISGFLAPSYDKTVIPVSGGQKQRLAIARAILKNPKILLLDEATSALDRKTEMEIQESLNDCMKGKTVITIAHR
jgi:ATP-binding cassette subfamily B (MDR/TAP) protein 1